MKEIVLSLVLLSAVFLAGCGGFINGKQSSSVAIAHFHQLYNQKNLDEIWKEASPEFRAALTKEKYDEFMGALERKLGSFVSTSNEGWNIKSFNFKTRVFMTQNTVFEHGQGTESFTFFMDGTNAVLAGYYVQSMDLITK